MKRRRWRQNELRRITSELTGLVRPVHAKENIGGDVESEAFGG
jgi:hypothetical protein